jgi:hypothetical protein
MVCLCALLQGAKLLPHSNANLKVELKLYQKVVLFWSSGQILVVINLRNASVDIVIFRKLVRFTHAKFVDHNFNYFEG